MKGKITITFCNTVKFLDDKVFKNAHFDLIGNGKDFLYNDEYSIIINKDLSIINKQIKFIGFSLDKITGQYEKVHVTATIE